MKKPLSLALIILHLFAFGQHPCSSGKTRNAAVINMLNARSAALNPQLSHELKYDVKFVHLNLNVERTNLYISGGVKTVATVTANALDTFMTLLHQNYTIDSVRINGALLNSVRVDSMIKVKLPSPLANGATFTAQVYYKGSAPGATCFCRVG